MDDHKQSVIKLIRKRINKGESYFHIVNYKKRLKQIWKDIDEMVSFIDSIDIDQLFNECKGGIQQWQN